MADTTIAISAYIRHDARHRLVELAHVLVTRVFVIALPLVVIACSTQPRAPEVTARRPADVRAEVVRLMPASVTNRDAWATDITAAFAALGVDPTTSNLCATLAVTEQESTFTSDPEVPGLGKIARGEINRRAKERGIPQLLVRGALALTSSTGKSYNERIAAVRTERQMSEIYEDLISRVPMGQRLFAKSNPVRTGGPMQVGIAFAERHAREHGYPYAVDGSIRHEVFSRRGGLYFGIAHLLGYSAEYDRPLYRFADFNAGWYASRNAAFQNAISLASGIPLALDGDLVSHDDSVGATELAVRSLAKSLEMSDTQIRRALENGDDPAFASSRLHERAFALAEKIEGRTLPRAVIPRIDLKSPKITRKLTTEWFATRVDRRYLACMAKSATPARIRSKA